MLRRGRSSHAGSLEIAHAYDEVARSHTSSVLTSMCEHHCAVLRAHAGRNRRSLSTVQIRQRVVARTSVAGTVGQSVGRRACFDRLALVLFRAFRSAISVRGVTPPDDVNMIMTILRAS
eukprot:7375858-Prymnesium_polylepis.1